MPDVELIMTSRKFPFLPLTGIRVDVISTVTAYPYFQPPASYENLHRAYVGISDPLNLTGKWIYQLGSKHDHSYMTNDNPQLISERCRTFGISSKHWRRQVPYQMLLAHGRERADGTLSVLCAARRSTRHFAWRVCSLRAQGAAF